MKQLVNIHQRCVQLRPAHCLCHICKRVTDFVMLVFLLKMKSLACVIHLINKTLKHPLYMIQLTELS